MLKVLPPKVKEQKEMNSKKLQEYSLTGSIHTMAVKSQGIVTDIMDEVSNCITSSSQTKDGTTTTSIINPNKLCGDVFKYSEFETVLDTILAGAGIGDYNIIRADLRLDSYDEKHYKDYAKLNRYLISALAVTYKVRNCYKTNGLFSQRQLSVAIKNKYFECENYDKAAESDGKDIATSRLEERSKAWTDNDLKKEFTEKWFNRWDKAIKNLDEVQKRYNDELEKIYKEDKNAYPRRFMSLREFLMQYQDCIFCKKQMIDLLDRIADGEIKDSKSYAENYKKKYGIEYFSKKDIERAIDEVKRATIEFFET